MSTDKKIITSMLLVAIVTLLVKFLGAGKELLIAHSFGTGKLIDAFLLSFMFPAFIVNVLAGAFSSSVMPTYIMTLEQKGNIRANNLLSSILALAILVLLSATFITAFVAPTILNLVAIGFDQATQQLTQTMFYYLLPLILVMGVNQFYITVINAHEKFTIVALSPGISPFITMVALIFFIDLWGIYALLVGLSVGALIEMITLAYIVKQLSVPILPIWYGINAELKTVIQQYKPMIAGAFLMSGTVLVDQSMAAMLNPGSVATLNYANKIVAMILTVGSMAIGTAILPHFSKLVLENNWSVIKSTLIFYSKLIVVVTIPLTVILFLMSESVVRVLFERGEFSSQDTLFVAESQAFYILQLPFYLLSILGVRLISAINRNDVLLKICIVNIVINVVGNYILMNIYGVAGIALSTLLVTCISFSLVYMFIYSNMFVKK